MNEDLKGRALRAAAAIFVEVAPLDTLDATVAALAAAWLDGFKAGTAEVLEMLSQVEPEPEPPRIDCCDPAVATGGAYHSERCSA